MKKIITCLNIKNSANLKVLEKNKFFLLTAKIPKAKMNGIWSNICRIRGFLTISSIADAAIADNVSRR